MIKNVIFDLGGVILEIDRTRMADAFYKLGAGNFYDAYSSAKSDKLFDDFCTGKIFDYQFRKAFQEKLGIHVSDKEFDSAMNAMLVDIPIEKLNLVYAIKKNCKTILFSNIHCIHYRAIIKMCRKKRIASLSYYFDKEYYSYIMRQKKPDFFSFYKILDENNIRPKETLFVDDTFENIVTAEKIGLQTFFLSPDENIYRVMSFF